MTRGIGSERMRVLAADPIKCPGCYSLHLYCKWINPAHGWRRFPEEIDDFQTYAEAAREARRRGWILHRDRTATCPQCRSMIGIGSPLKWR